VNTDLYWRFFSLFLAVILWVIAVDGRPDVIQREVTVDLEVVRAAEGALVSIEPGQVRVLARGVKVEDEQIRAFVDVQGKTGSHLLPVETTSPRGVEIIRVVPAAVAVNVDLPKSREVPVMVGTWAIPGQRQVVDVQSLKPRVVTVWGAEAQIAQVERAVVRLTLLPGDEVEGTFGLQLVDARGNVVPGVWSEPDKVEVSVRVPPAVRELVLPVEPQLVGEPALGFAVGEVEVSPRQVTLLVPENIKFDGAQILTEPISIAEAEADIELDAKLQAPAGVGVEPSSVKVGVRIVPVTTDGPVE
jgi:YbbR domain-containing protein